MDNIVIFALFFAAWNSIVFFTYGVDKSRAKKHKRRISEKTLMLLAVFMGGIGALLGMQVFRHKTKHLKFKVGVPLLVILNIAIIAAGVYLYIL